MLSYFLRRNLNKVYTARYYSSKNNESVPWSDKLYVNYLKLPEFINIHGPTGEQILKDKDLTDKTCVITGGTSGIGAEIIRCLLNKNCNVAMACRNLYSAGVLTKNLWGDSNRLSTYEIDLASLSTVKGCTDKILNDHPKIDIVFLNAAVFGLPWTMTVDKLETIFQVNFLSQYLFLMNIEQNLAPNARVIFLSSESHKYVNWTFQETVSPIEEILSLPEENYTSIKAYNTSKLCGIFTMHYLAYRWSKKNFYVFCVHPGSFVSTQICLNWWAYELLYGIMRPFSKSIPQAASSPLYCATSPDLDGMTDVYVKNCMISKESELAQNNHLAFKIVDLSRVILRERVELPQETTTRAKQTIYEQQDETKNPIPESILST